MPAVFFWWGLCGHWRLHTPLTSQDLALEGFGRRSRAFGLRLPEVEAKPRLSGISRHELNLPHQFGTPLTSQDLALRVREEEQGVRAAPG